MKKTLIAAILVSGLSVSVVFAAGGGKKSKTNTTTSVSYTVLNQFAYDFKDAKYVIWTVNKNCQKADFTLNGQKMTAFYSLSGEYIGVTHIIAFEKLPIAAQKQITVEYKDYKVGDVIELQPNQSEQSSGYFSTATYSDGSKVDFVDLKNDKEELLLKVTNDSEVSFFKQVK